MAIRKFVAPTTREAMMQVRRELGDDAVIIANRRVGNRIEILAAEPDAVEALVQRSETRAVAQRADSGPAERAASRDAARPKVEAFQDFVRRQMTTDNENRAQPRAAREIDMPVRTFAPGSERVANVGRQAGNNAGVAMYHDVADYEDEEVMSQPAPRPPMRAAAEAPLRQAVAQTGAPRPSHRAQQIETMSPAADPAVFRRRPAQVAPRIDGAATPAAARIAPAAPLPIDIVLEPQPIELPVPAQATKALVVEAPVAVGHAPVPSLPVRSQAAPIATAARLREASLNAAAQMAAAMQTARVAADSQASSQTVEAVRALQAAQPINVPLPQQATPAQQPVQGPQASQAQAPQMPQTSQPAQTVLGAHAPQVAQVQHAARAPQSTIAPQAPPSLQAQPAPETPQQAAQGARPVDVTAAPTQPVLQAVAPAPTKPALVAPMWSWETRLGASPTINDVPQLQPTVATVVAVEPAATPALPAQAAEPRVESQLLAELQTMRDMLREQIATLATKPAPEVTPASTSATRVMTRLLTAGFSADVARRIAAHAPHNADAAHADGWLQEVLAHNIRCVDANDGIVERAGRPASPGQTFALVGPTGVGKTTTVAKLAARFAVRHGTSALGLITLDAYRVAAPEQLRTYGRILGTPVHLAQDSATLRELLATMVHKRLVLIDTCGVSQRDERLAEMLDLLASAGSASRPVQRVLLLNSASHAETLDEAARAWRAQECAGAILTKLDEATRIGGSLDATLRHRLTLFGVTNGQRVPEDWRAANSKVLAHLALKPGGQLFELADDEGAALMQPQPVAHAAAHG